LSSAKRWSIEVIHQEKRCTFFGVASEEVGFARWGLLVLREKAGIECVTVELRHVRYFNAVAEHLSFRKATEHLHIALRGERRKNHRPCMLFWSLSAGCTSYRD